MDYIPKAEWQWVFDLQQGKLSVVDRERTFPIVYESNMLRLRESQVLSFTVDDVSRYIELFESESLSHFEESLRCKIILHLIAIDLFHKPMMPKSWLFQTSEHQQTQYNNGELAMLTTSGMPESAKYMVLEQQDNFCLCMLFDEIHTFSNGKIFKQFQIIKVTADKLTPCLESQPQEWVSFQNAG
ncbi:cell division protein ZapC domain-containing protein [uncultured Psychromonas sp.]|uniref:cell division protein ZapC domain-containing protein n=1 Tax=uncultured Psychromonas sp. TaxID=173974 RepID=UPI00261381CF|nr:cell division protein ZapC domain-containing protein [uncultured Psychromonas sp.]